MIELSPSRILQTCTFTSATFEFQKDSLEQKDYIGCCVLKGMEEIHEQCFLHLYTSSVME